jgi:hypothetical protein
MYLDLIMNGHLVAETCRETDCVRANKAHATAHSEHSQVQTLRMRHSAAGLIVTVAACYGREQ